MNHREPGNIIVLVVALGAVVLAIALACFWFSAMYLLRNKVQAEADSIALTVGQALNSSNRSARVNALMGKSRELVYTSKALEPLAQRKSPHLLVLARQLARQAEAGAAELEQERAALVTDNLRRLDATVQELQSKYASRGNLGGMQFSDISVEAFPGYMDGITSNAEAASGIDELKQHDITTGYLDADKGFLKGNIDARLPAPAGALPFKIAVLQPFSQRVSAAALCPSDLFRALDRGEGVQLPSAAHVMVKFKVKTEQGAPQTVNVSAVAAYQDTDPPWQ